MVEIEQPDGISARKLVLETAKYNVITAYSAQEGIDTVRRFPAIDVLIIHSQISGMPHEELVKQIRSIRPDIPVIMLSPSGQENCSACNHVLNSHDPQALLNLLNEKYRPTLSKSNNPR